VYFAFFRLDPSVAISGQWNIYTHPLNNLFLYIIGISFFYNFHNLKVNQAINFIFLFLAGFIFVVYPYISQSDTISGFNRLIYSGCISLSVFSFYKMEVKSINIIGKIFEKFGIATYGVYILHPIIIRIVNFASKKYSILTINQSIGISIILTIAIAFLSYYKLELKISNYGKKIEKEFY
jgi:peptidoglycan/LPS O-acetylase OafA/YrhL